MKKQHSFYMIKIITGVLFAGFSTMIPLTLSAKNNNVLVQDDNIIPDVPKFSITYLDEALVCSPLELIKTKSHKDFVTYKCSKKNVPSVSKKKENEKRGVDETSRLTKAVKEQIEQGSVHTVQIPLSSAHNPIQSQLIAEQQLKDRPHGKYIRMFLPAKIYLSLRPQLTNSGNDRKMELRNGGSRGGFFYYHQFNNDLELRLQYEAKVDRDKDTPFINASDTSDSSRRLSYFALTSGKHSIIAGKYWSAYYDIASFTDRFMAYGAHAGGAFNGGTDGSPSGTGRADMMLQARTKQEMYDATMQVQFRHDARRNFDTDYLYTAAGSFIYKGWENIKAGASFAYGEFDERTSKMGSFGIDGNDLAAIAGVAYSENALSINTTLSYSKNHMSDDQDNYFDALGAELYIRYDFDEGYRLAAGGNWLIPRDNDYEDEYSVRDLIFSFQYTFGEKTFDDLVYIEASLPSGELANGEKRDSSITMGIRFLLDK